MNTPQGAIPISLVGRCFHDGVPTASIVIDWFLDLAEYGMENGWRFSEECVDLWLAEEYGDEDRREIMLVIGIFLKV